MQMALPTKPHTNRYVFPFKGGQYVSKPHTRISSNVSKKVRPCSIRSSAIATPSSDQTATVSRRSGNYEPSVWDFNFIQSLNSTYTGECYAKQASELKQQVDGMLQEGAMEQVDQLELIDNLQNLGIAPHFQDKIKQILESIYQSNYGATHKPKQMKDLHATALEFRLLRQHGFHIPQEIFDCFKNEKGDFKASLGEDTKGLLQLYEASFLLTEGESSLEQAREFTTNLLQENLNNIDDDNLSLLVHRALELPRHCMLLRANVRWFLDAYGRRPDMNPTLFELAKLDFNIYQANVQQELKHISSWWKETGLAEKLPFSRDRVVESYFWTTGIEPLEQGHERLLSTKIIMLETVLDDIFDVYATPEELQLFYDVIQRWDLESIEKLPIYMQIYFVALNNTVNEIAYHILKQQGVVIIPHLRKSWMDLCEAYMKEAVWYNNGVKPSLKEYLENAWISVGVPTFLYQVYFLVTNPIEKEATKYLDEYHDIIRWSSMIARLADDVATAGDELERGDVPKSVQCYMNETSASDEEAREAMRLLIWEAWKKLNKYRISSSCPFPEVFIQNVVNLARVGQSIYQYGDGYGYQHFETKNKDRMMSMLFDPVA
ncbi:(-)-alpha-terpineol synthase [Handroanthus impetiginosus]|uniref:(-)-alpha-terpineol synthase n=1 Tax=Handroanthus impetiginosus TaxID=429701 RepID=A0A2G9HPL9_9LAMI|nr:(-)-alpha-terpineol synthase [Handroanthus impetiginosus]